jgi:hypothetical protein
MVNWPVSRATYVLVYVPGQRRGGHTVESVCYSGSRLMPFQQPDPLAGLASQLATLDERMRAREQNRFGRAGLYAHTPFTTSSATYVSGGWGALPVSIGASGGLITFVQISASAVSSGSMLFGVSFDGSPTVVIGAQSVSTSAATIPGFIGFTGAPFSTHTAEVFVSTNSNPTTFKDCFLVAWPI